MGKRLPQHELFWEYFEEVGTHEAAALLYLADTLYYCLVGKKEDDDEREMLQRADRKTQRFMRRRDSESADPEGAADQGGAGKGDAASSTEPARKRRQPSSG